MNWWFEISLLLAVVVLCRSGCFLWPSTKEPSKEVEKPSLVEREQTIQDAVKEKPRSASVPGYSTGGNLGRDSFLGRKFYNDYYPGNRRGYHGGANLGKRALFDDCNNRIRHYDFLDILPDPMGLKRLNRAMD